MKRKLLHTIGSYCFSCLLKNQTRLQGRARRMARLRRRAATTTAQYDYSTVQARTRAAHILWKATAMGWDGAWAAPRGLQQGMGPDEVGWLMACRAGTYDVLAGVDHVLRTEMPALVPMRWQSDAQRQYREKLDVLGRELAFSHWQLALALETIDRSLSAAAADAR